MKKMKNKKERGITLIALVVTIIILLILAGISISALTNTGIFGKAQEAEGKTKLADAKESMTLLLHEWQMEHETSDKTLETFLGEKEADSTIESYNKLGDGNYEVYIKGHVGVIDGEGNLVEDVQKAGPRPTISNVKTTTDGTTEVADNSQIPGTKLKINFSSSIENGTIKSVTPAVLYETNGTETEVTFTIVGTVDGTDYTTKKTISVASKYKQRQYPAVEANKVFSTTANTTLQDTYLNKIVVPAGFKIVSNADTNNATTVDKGIVIEDATSTETAGSQFVWIPVGTIAKSDGTTVEINLNRYTFDGNGISTPQGENVVETYYSETASKGNTVAKSITNFKNSVTTIGGYYIGRYEARQNKSGTTTEVGTDTIWNYINQSTAATKAQNMYDSTTHLFTSDLMNSYAWDTATLFLQSCGTNNKYSRQTRVSSSFATTGTNNQTIKDVQCNVFDMASNVLEWTTESSSGPYGPCVFRGGYDYDSNYSCYVSSRFHHSTSHSNGEIGFRTLLYL